MQQSTSSVHSSSFLLRQFRDFYREVIRLKRTASAGVLKFQSMVGTESQPTTSSMVNSIWQNLVFNLEHQASAASRSGNDYSVSIYKETMYVMAALADEVFLTLSWEGKEQWNEKLLESYFFQSHIAGEEFFRRLDNLMQSRDAMSVELASVYFMALSLGFQGKFRGHDDIASLEKYKQQLFTFIFRRDPELLQESKQIFPSTYENTVTKGTGKRLPNPKKWFLIATGTVVVYYIISHLLWMDITGDFYPIITSILGFH